MQRMPIDLCAYRRIRSITLNKQIYAYERKAPLQHLIFELSFALEVRQFRDSRRLPVPSLHNARRFVFDASGIACTTTLVLLSPPCVAWLLACACTITVLLLLPLSKP